MSCIVYSEEPVHMELTNESNDCATIMNTSHLECCIECDEILTARVIGVFASDRILNVPIHHELIVNTDKSTSPGQHWCAIFNDGHGHVEFFDRYCRPPEENSVHILKWIRETAKT